MSELQEVRAYVEEKYPRACVTIFLTADKEDITNEEDLLKKDWHVSYYRSEVVDKYPDYTAVLALVEFW